MRIAREVGRPLVGTGDVHYLRREDYHHHTALLCVQTKSTLAAPKMTFDTNEFFLRSSEEMARRVRRVARGARTPRWRSPSAATSRSSSASSSSRATCPRARTSAPTCASASCEGLRARYGDPSPAARDRARRARARGHRPDGLQRLLPDRVGLRQVGEGQRHRRRPGPRLGGRLDRRLRAAHHRRRPAALRPALRALPQPRARVDARHRHRLLRARPRARHALRHRRGTGASRSRRSSPSARCSRAPRRATPRACSATTTASATAWPSSSPTRSWAARRASTTA